MLSLLKSVIRTSPLRPIAEAFRGRCEARSWERSGRPVPPPHIVKQRVVKEYANAFALCTLVETGTYLGDMVLTVRESFNRIVSVELDRALFEQAKSKFSDSAHVSIIHGNSSEVLPAILTTIDEPCLFWLDGHYSGGSTARGDLETPIIGELTAIFDRCLVRHVILIDDARMFLGQNDYPSLEDVRALVSARRPGWIMEVKDDIIRIHESLHLQFCA